MTADAIPVATAISQRDDGEHRVFEWSIENPTLQTRFRFEWRFRGDKEPDDPHVAPSERMHQIGVIQQGHPILSEPCRPFDLPGEAELAASYGGLLVSYLNPIRASHTFGKGIGLAAPQIGLPRAAAVVQTPDDEALVLYNPRIIEAGDETDEKYEGCLSFFNVRGKVRRPLQIEVEHTTLDGEKRTTTFERGTARLWAHEIDHLDGVLYTDRMPAGVDPIPVERYTAIGEDWRY